MAKNSNKKNSAPEPIVFYKPNLKILWISFAVFIPIIFLLIYHGYQGLILYPASSGDPFRYFAGYLPLAMALIIIAVMYSAYRFYVQRNIGISKAGFVFADEHQQYTLEWKNLKATFPRDGQKKFNDRAILTDGTNSIVFERMFYPKRFDAICKKIAQQQLKHKRDNSTIDI